MPTSGPKVTCGVEYIFDRAPDFLDLDTGLIEDHEICQLSLMAYAEAGLSATITIEDFQLNVGENDPIALGTFSQKSSDVGPTIRKFCRDDYDQEFSFAGLVKPEGDFVESGDQWIVQVECGAARTLTVC
ncbi:hypothetical protein NDN08_002034 [Rhodosorus marinus]|uniref:Uncharacterized protein n=1 Tax=Rhodosorus marinus TaxID=101924 RepID=A0AAV8UWW6_9RHOD|nr:hypothetical protein NDN08_002034 [Rhodosorus marinus]